MANSNFYANIGVNAGFIRSQSSSSSHTEGAAVTTLKPMDENSSITYSNVNNITYQGTQAQGGTFIYNNVANIQKEAVELHNSYSSSSSSRGINAGATIDYGHKIQTTGNGGSISASQSNQNTVETIYANGSFKNVNEVHNNTGSMVLNGFNQEGGKLTGNIGKVEVISRQNTSTTTGSSRGMSLGISANGVPSSVNISGSRTNGDRAFVDNQSTFIVGEGSSLHVGTLENTGAVVGKEGNSTFKINNYVGKDIQNHDTMKTTGGSLGISTEKPRITNVGFNQDSRDKQGITRNTVVGDVEIAGAEGSPINRDLGKANEVTRDTHSSTNINVESQTIEYAANPGKLKEDIGKAKEEINDIKWAIKESIHDRGDDNRNFFGQLSEVRLNKSLENITGERLIGKTVDTEIAGIFKDAYKDLGYDINIIFSDPKNSPQLLDEKGKPKTGTAYVRDENGKKIKTIIINGKDPKNATKAGLIGTIVEEGSHVIGKVEGRQRKTGTDEKGLESTGRASNEYFAEKYKDDNTRISIHSDGKDYSNVDFGENVGDKRYKNKKELIDTHLYVTGPYAGQINRDYFDKVYSEYGSIDSDLGLYQRAKSFDDRLKFFLGTQIKNQVEKGAENLIFGALKEINKPIYDIVKYVVATGNFSYKIYKNISIPSQYNAELENYIWQKKKFIQDTADSIIFASQDIIFDVTNEVDKINKREPVIYDPKDVKNRPTIYNEVYKEFYDYPEKTYQKYKSKFDSVMKGRKISIRELITMQQDVNEYFINNQDPEFFFEAGRLRFIKPRERTSERSKSVGRRSYINKIMPELNDIMNKKRLGK